MRLCESYVASASDNVLRVFSIFYSIYFTVDHVASFLLLIGKMHIHDKTVAYK